MIISKYYPFKKGVCENCENYIGYTELYDENEGEEQEELLAIRRIDWCYSYHLMCDDIKVCKKFMNIVRCKYLFRNSYGHEVDIPTKEHRCYLKEVNCGDVPTFCRNCEMNLSRNEEESE